jgi:hypothetical protein
MMHFTFKAPPDGDLQQGDLIEKNDALLALLENIHPLYLRADYRCFIVLTQSCDLVRRRDHTCNSRYITLAPVRPLDIVVSRELAKYQDAMEAKGEICSKSRKDRVQMFVKRLLNNNEAEYFYLHSEPSAKLPDSCCAFLRLSTTVRSYEHYEVCLGARFLSLSPVFQAKLGWLVGNIYSRVGTDDWTPDHYPEADFDKVVARIVDEACMWVDEAKLREARKQLKDTFASMDREELRSQIQELSSRPKIDQVTEQVVTVLRQTGLIQDDALAKDTQRRLRNDPKLASLVK